MTRVLVTGAAGRLGRSVVGQLIHDGFEVIAVDRRLPSAAGAVNLELDLLDAPALAATFAQYRPDALVHLAAIAVPFSAPEGEILRTNVALGYGVIEAALQAGATKIVVSSSPTVLGYGTPSWRPQRLPLDEDSPREPWNAYALSKVAVEETVAMFARGAAPRARFAVFRPCYVIAPEEWLGAPTQQGHTVRERLDDAKLSAPALFNYVDARDVGTFIVRLLDRMPGLAPFETFFVGAEDAFTRAAMPTLLREFFPQWAALASGLPGAASLFSSEKAQRLLDWTPQRTWQAELASVEQSPTEATA
jgi:UDP-glucose 4-epimerase